MKQLKIAFLGGGKASDATMALAEKIGYRLATLHDFIFCTGGYGGIMEAPLKGVARYAEESGSERGRYGYVLNTKPKSNEYAWTSVCGGPNDSPELSFGIRLGALLASDFLIFFEGGAGTRVELASAIHLAKNAEALGLIEPKHIILVCKKGEENKATAGLWSILDDEERALIYEVETAEGVVGVINLLV